MNRVFSQHKHTYALIRVLMRTGKHAGKIVTIMDIPFITEHGESDGVKSLLPGLEGEGVRLPHAGSAEN